VFAAYVVVPYILGDETVPAAGGIFAAPGVGVDGAALEKDRLGRACLVVMHARNHQRSAAPHAFGVDTRFASADAGVGERPDDAASNAARRCPDQKGKQPANAE